ncbi:hypothetical protein DDB_G0288561 [Dictyostelium discoideum AX4]|uniref:Uncharacterized protein n=1 Tax=Dictyostelium discoideum TaxID=44689 RepID=Q54IS2_DICDI|nr:hypothetical protein DDB_G0288561 [Dictyostelium discoideum AX4]EAL63140.1 hypothetical protein DDB_G0288561 [Dictyostelium discoideum AX4]|eukprot:XP_636642.1 hypothetical protein DDB_G0288561 [Dictyostelium discoideum AX4]
MVELLGFFRCNRNKSFADETNIFIIPFLTGTNPGPTDIELLKWDFENISINILSLQSSKNKKFEYNWNTLECLLYHIVCGVEVSWEIVISGNIIKEISKSGHIYLVQNSNSGFFNIIIPTVDLNLIATRLPMDYLSTITRYPPDNKFVRFSFEYITSIIIILKNDLLQKYKSIIVNLKDIFGDIIDDNDIMIKFKQLYLVKDSSNLFYGYARKTIAIEEPGYISLLCDDCTIFEIRLNFKLESSSDNSKTNLMVVIKTYYTNSDLKTPSLNSISMQL